VKGRRRQSILPPSKLLIGKRFIMAREIEEKIKISKAGLSILKCDVTDFTKYAKIKFVSGPAAHIVISSVYEHRVLSIESLAPKSSTSNLRSVTFLARAADI